MINYLGQIIRGFILDAEIFANHRITSGHVKNKVILIDIIEVFRKRNTIDKPCGWNEDDSTIMRGVIKMAECKPPHWNITTEYPICNTKEKMKNVTIDLTHLKHASPTFLKQFRPPCHGILAATLNVLVDQRQNFSSLTSTDEVDLTHLGYHFKNEHYKEIVYTEAFDFMSLVASIGGHIGLHLGFAFWQLPDFIKFLRNEWRGRVGYPIYCFLDVFRKILIGLR